MMDLKNCKLHEGDCLEVMKSIDDESIDLICCDLPYGTTSIKWDSVLDYNKMWEQYGRIIKPKGIICLFGSQPFTSQLICSKIDYRFDIACNFVLGLPKAIWQALTKS